MRSTKNFTTAIVIIYDKLFLKKKKEKLTVHSSLAFSFVQGSVSYQHSVYSHSSKRVRMSSQDGLSLGSAQQSKIRTIKGWISIDIYYQEDEQQKSLAENFHQT